jgi:molecular chaperone DnaJ
MKSSVSHATPARTIFARRTSSWRTNTTQTRPVATRPAEEKLKEVNAAYDILKNPEKRQKYDRFGDQSAGGFEGAGGGQGFEAPFEDFFDMLFGQGGQGGRRRSSAQPGNDLEMRLVLTLSEAATGVKKKVKFSRHETCGDCSGSGAAPGTKPEACQQCGGSGQVRVTHGFFSVTRTCHVCRGVGKMITKPCRKCNGAGAVKTQRELSVDVPAGVDTGSRLRVSGEGEPGVGGGPRGDLYLAIEIEKHEHFQRDGVNLYLDIPITITQAALGDTVRVPTLDGEAELRIPAGTQPGTQLRMRGLGLPDIRGYRQGDLIVRVQVEIPQKLTKRQRELLEEFQQLSDQKTYPLYRRFIDSLLGGKGGGES